MALAVDAVFERWNSESDWEGPYPVVEGQLVNHKVSTTSHSCNGGWKLSRTRLQGSGLGLRLQKGFMSTGSSALECKQGGLASGGNLQQH